MSFLDHLQRVAAADERAFLDVRMNQLYFAMCQHDDHLYGPTRPTTATLPVLNAALDALSVAEIRRHMQAPEPPDSIYERMLEYKEARLAELKRAPTALPNAPNRSTTRSPNRVREDRHGVRP